MDEARSKHRNARYHRWNRQCWDGLSVKDIMLVFYGNGYQATIGVDMEVYIREILESSNLWWVVLTSSTKGHNRSVRLLGYSHALQLK